MSADKMRAPRGEAASGANGTATLGTVARVGQRRRLSVLAATLTGGSGEIVDFLVPLWAGAALGASPSVVGALVAAEMVVSFLARPAAGWLADTRGRTRVAAAGAALYGLSCLGYAAAEGLPVAFTAAVLGGVGGAVFWVAIRALAAERLPTDAGTFAGLFAAESFGSWFFWFPAMVLLPAIGYRGVFAALGLVCFVAAAALLFADRVPGHAQDGEHPLRADLRRLRPLLAVVALSAAAEAGVGLLLLMHLQRGFDLPPYAIALVFLPGGIAMTVLARPLHRIVERRGRRLMVAASFLASATFAATLALAPNPLVIAALWVLTAASWAALVPIEQAVVGEVSGPRAGRGMGLYGNAGLLGGAGGALLAGWLYEATTWQWACLGLALVMVLGAVLGPRALAALGVADRPIPAEDRPSNPGRDRNGQS